MERKSLYLCSPSVDIIMQMLSSQLYPYVELFWCLVDLCAPHSSANSILIFMRSTISSKLCLKTGVNIKSLRQISRRQEKNKQLVKME